MHFLQNKQICRHFSITQIGCAGRHSDIEMYILKLPNLNQQQKESKMDFYFLICLCKSGNAN